MADDKKRLPDLSDRLLAEAEALQRVEREKRKEPISSPRFHELAEEITEHSRRVFAAATDEEAAGDRAPTGEESIEDVGRR